MFLGVLWLTTLGTSLQAQSIALDITVSPPLESAANRLRSMDQEGLVRSLTAAGLPVPPRAMVLLVEDGDERVRRIPGWIVGLASGTDRILIFPQRIGSYPYDSLPSVLRHELVHLSLNIATKEQPLPRWFHEGAAVELESGWSTADQMRLLLAALDPPSLAHISRLFASDAQPDTAQAYLLSAALVDGVVHRHGTDAIGRIAGQVALGLPFDDAFARATGESVDVAAARAWRGHRQLSRWIPLLTSPPVAWFAILGLAVLAFGVQLRKRRAQRRQWNEEDEEDEEEDGELPRVDMQPGADGGEGIERRQPTERAGDPE